MFIYTREYIIYKYQDGFPTQIIPHYFYDSFDYVYFEFIYIKPYIVALSNANLNIIDEVSGAHF
jgi:hypothetical protein